MPGPPPSPIPLAASVLARLRRTGLSMVGGTVAGRSLRRVLEPQLVRITEHLTRDGALGWAREHPLAPIVIFDDDKLDETQALVDALDRRSGGVDARPRPVIVVVSRDLERGLAALGWHRSTFRVAFVRSQSLLDDFSHALTDLLSGEPEPDPGDPTLEAPVVGALLETRFDVEDLKDQLASRLAWLAPQVERVMGTLVFRFSAPFTSPGADTVDAQLSVGWLNAEGSHFRLTMDGRLLPAGAAGSLFQARVPRGLRGALDKLRQDRLVGEPGFDDEYVVHADDAGLHEARAVLAQLSRLPGELDTLRWTEDAFTARGAALTSSSLVTVADAVTQVWSMLVRARLGLGSDARP